MFFFSVNVFPQKNIKNLQSKIDQVLSDEFFNSTIASVSVYDLTSGEYLYQKNTDLLLRPASNLKILTTTAGLLFLGPDYNFTTSLYYTGQISGGILLGDLYIVGAFDPLLTTNDLDTLIIGLKQAGIKNIVGNIYGDVSSKDSLFWGAGWMWDDDPSTDAPYLSPLTINENSVKIICRPGEVDSLVRVELIPNSNYYSFKNKAITIAADSSKIKVTRGWISRKNNISVSGYLSQNAEPDTNAINLYDPAKYFLSLFTETLFRNHILFNGSIDTAKLKGNSYLIGLCKHRLSEAIDPLLKDSDNLYSELLLYTLAKEFYGEPANAENGVKMVDSLITLIGKNPKNYRIVDGSGVSHYNLITSDLIIEVLKYLYYNKPDFYNLIYKSFPVAGVDGTLDERMIGTSAENNVHAKTGTLSGVSCLSGYVTAKNDHTLAFSIMIQNYITKSKIAKSFEDEICNVLANYK